MLGKEKILFSSFTPSPSSREIEIPEISLGCGILAARFFSDVFVVLNKNDRRF
jgi:hypothetical protein